MAAARGALLAVRWRLRWRPRRPAAATSSTRSGAKGDDSSRPARSGPYRCRQAATCRPRTISWSRAPRSAKLLASGGKDTSVPWENPRTGARGTITPIASAYSQDGLTCRDFLASYMRDGSGILAAGRSLPRRPGPVGSAQPQALAADWITLRGDHSSADSLVGDVDPDAARIGQLVLAGRALRQQCLAHVGLPWLRPSASARGSCSRR